MSDKLNEQLPPKPEIELESPGKILHDIITPLLTSQMNAELLNEYIPQLITTLNRLSIVSNLLPEDKTILEALTQAPNIINNNLAIVQKKIRALANAIDNNNNNNNNKFVAPELGAVQNNASKAAPLQLTQPIQHILLVDDEEIHRDIGIKILSPHYIVECATTGFEAINMCKKKHFELILMDMQMPRMDGAETTKELRAVISKKTIIVGLSSMPLGEHRTELLKLGFSAFLEKPLKLNSLQNLLGFGANNV